MRVPDYPSNREADEGTNTTAERREGVPEKEAKSGDLFARFCSWGGATLCGDDASIRLPPLRRGRGGVFFAVCLNKKREKE